MSPTDIRAEIPLPQNFHPEFGYLCPSAALRRKVRNAAMTALAGMVIAAGAALALAPHPLGDGDDVREEPALLAVAVSPPIEEAMPVTMPVATPVTMAPPFRVTYRSGLARRQTSCDDLSESFLVPQCRSGKTGKSHLTRSAHAASRRGATIPPGRIDATPAAAQRSAAAPRPIQAVEATAAQAAVATTEALRVSVTFPVTPTGPPL